MTDNKYTRYSATTNQLSLSELQELEKQIFACLMEIGHPMTRIDIGTWVYNFEQKFSLRALYNFHRWMMDHKNDVHNFDHAYAETIYHDLNGVYAGKFFVPRSESYIDYIPGETHE